MIVLASHSASRKAMLDAAGVAYEAHASAVDEAALKAVHTGLPGAELAVTLATAKACDVSLAFPGRLVLGGDSLVEVAGRQFDKPSSRAEAAAHLAFFSGQTMALSSAAVLVRDGVAVWHSVETAQLQMRALSPAFIEHYLDREWPAVAACVGVFRIEALGPQLFETISGSHFTVLGMPLLAVLAALRANGVLPA